MKTLTILIAAGGLVGATLAQQPTPTANLGPETPRAQSSQPAVALAVPGPSPGQRQWLAKAERHEKAGWIYLHIEGEPRERGFQHGYLLAKEIAECLRIRRAVWRHNTSMEWADLLKETARFVTPFIDPENREELLGIVDGLRAAAVAATLEDLAAYNAYMELEWYWWPEVLKKLNGGTTAVTPPKQSCSSFIATGSMTRGGGVVLAHNTMLDYVDAYCQVIVDIVSAKGHRILMQTSPGWIHSGTLDGKVVDAAMAKRMSFAARWGSACGRAFDATKYLQDHAQFDWLEGLLKDLPSEPWVEFVAGEH